MAKILVIEDEESVRENLLDLLEAENYETVAAPNGKIGLDLAMSEKPDLILCDMMMPELDGHGVLTGLQQDSSTATIPFIFLTARSAKSDFREGMDKGADDYLTKPFTRTELLRAIKNKLEKYAKLKDIIKNNVNPLTPRLQLVEKHLKHCITKENFQGFQVHYQPIMDINTGRITAAESLLRWYSDDLGRVSPEEFIPLAEGNGLIVAIGDWVLQTVCEQLKIWNNEGIHNLTLAVNLSAMEFNEKDLIPKIMGLICSKNIQANCLELELTERMIVKDIGGTINAMNQLRSLGVKMAIDDFGTGVSAFVYLKQFPVNTLKIDREFVQDVGNDYKKASITKALIEMGHSLNLKIVAEGVETESELAFLRENKCDFIQGFICSPPLPAEEFKKLLLTNESFSS